jgi:hypothetical protein
VYPAGHWIVDVSWRFSPPAVRCCLCCLVLALFSPEVHAQDGLRRSRDTLRHVQAARQPARTAEALAGLLPSVFRDDRTDSLVVRGAGRLQTTLEGVPLLASLRVPYGLLGAVRLETGALDARHGGTPGSAVHLTALRAPTCLQVRVEGLAGPAPLDPGQSADALGTLGGALGRHVRVFVGGALRRADDPKPGARPLPRLTDAALEALRTTPQGLDVIGADGTPAFVPLPVLPAGTRWADVRARLPAGSRVDPRFGALFLVNAANRLTDADVTYQADRRGARLDAREAFGRVEVALPYRFGLDLLGFATRTMQDVPEAAYTFLNGTPAGRLRADAMHGQGRLSGVLAGVQAHLTAAYAATEAERYDARVGPGVAATFGYADLDAPYNALAAAYRVVQPTGRDTLLRVQYEDGFGPGSVAGLFALPGALPTAYARNEQRAAYAALDLDAAGAGLRVQGGALYEHQQARALQVPAAALRYFARIASDGRVEQGGAGVAAYAALRYENVRGRVAGYGYDAAGLVRARDDDFDATVACQRDATARACISDARTAPYAETRAGAYAQVHAAPGRLTFSLGLRVEAFGRAGRALVQPYALLPVVTAAEAGLASGAIAPDWVVYFNGATVAGFRDRAGRYYSPAGEAARRFEVIVNSGVAPRLVSGARAGELDARAFQAPAWHLRWQPRAMADLALGRRAVLFAYGSRTARAAAHPLAVATLADYQARLAGSGVIGNPDLAPEMADAVGAGARLAWGAGTLRVEAFQHHYTRLARPVVRTAFPGAYTTYENGGAARVRGLDALLSIAPHRHLHLRTAYTYETGQTDLEDALWNPAADATTYRTQQQTRHLLKAAAVLQTGAAEGPRVFGHHPLARSRAALFFDAASGRAYDRFAEPYSLAAPVRRTGLLGTGTQPWTYRLDLYAERAFAWRGATVAAFVWGENVLGRANVRRVYGATGEADDDGYLDTPSGRTEFPEGTPERLLYRLRLLDAAQYGVGRQVRIGLRLSLR